MGKENERTEHAKTCSDCGRRIEDGGTKESKLWFIQRKSERFHRTNKPLCAKCLAKRKLKDL